MYVMVARKKYPVELMERAVRLVFEERQSAPPGARGEIKRVAERLGIHPEALRAQVSKAEVDAGRRPGVTSAEAARIAELEREVRELRRANEILKAATAFFGAEFDRQSKK
jgi:transposase